MFPMLPLVKDIILGTAKKLEMFPVIKLTEKKF